MVDVDLGSIGFLVVVLVEVVVRISWHLTSLIQCVFNCTWVIAHAIGSLQRVQSLVLYTLNINDYIFVKCYFLFYLQAVGFRCSITFVSQTHSFANRGYPQPRNKNKQINIVLVYCLNLDNWLMFTHHLILSTHMLQLNLLKCVGGISHNAHLIVTLTKRCFTNKTRTTFSTGYMWCYA